MGSRPQKLELTWFNKDQALIPTEEGKYGYTWVDPKDPRYCETHFLITDDVVHGVQAPKEDGVNYSERADLVPQSDNLLILGESGDALEALTRVPELVDKYLGQVKCVYIDPPFNTAQTFVNYEDNLEHSVWLTMMRDRLVHLHKLLSDDGTIWVHLDDAENHRMRSLLDEVFGSGNFIANIVWERRTSKSNDAEISVAHDFVTVYGKNPAGSRKKLNKIAYPAEFSNPDNDPRGPWKTAPFAAPGIRPNMEYEITLPSGRVVTPPPGRCWPRPLEGYLALLGDNRIWFGPKGDANPSIKRFASEIEQTIVPSTIWFASETGTNTSGKKEIISMFPDESAFATPKPELLLERVLEIATNPGEIVLDIFAGSGTTAAVAQKMGRRWVTTELVEDTFDRFTLPRLTKVVNGKDMGGVSTTAGERVDNTDDGLPEGMTPDEAQKLISLLNKAISDQPDLKKDSAIKAVKNLVKTKKTKDVINWRGGGGFTVAHLSPACYDYDEELDLVTLTEAATGPTLVASVAANLRFYATPEDRNFDGVMGRQYLAVIEGVLDNDKVDDLMAHLPKGHTLLIAATIVTEGVRDYVRSFKNGSRVLSIPLDIFTYTKAQEEN